MHSIMMTSSPPLIYWLPATLKVVDTIRSWRAEGLDVCYTIDAGPNVHVICPTEISKNVVELLVGIDGVRDVLSAQPGEGAEITS